MHLRLSSFHGIKIMGLTWNTSIKAEIPLLFLIKNAYDIPSRRSCYHVFTLVQNMALLNVCFDTKRVIKTCI